MFPGHKLHLSCIILSLLLAACQPSNAGGRSTPPQPSTPNLALITENNIWQTILKPVPLPAPWSVKPCEGNAPLLCVFNADRWVGTIELAIYTLESLPDFQQMLRSAGLSSGQVTLSNPTHQAQIFTALRAWVSDYYGFFSKNRESEYGANVTFLSQMPLEVSVGDLAGLSYGFSGVESIGGIRESHVGFVAFDGKALYVITSAFDPLSETGAFETLSDFQGFEPYFSTLIGSLKLPI